MAHDTALRLADPLINGRGAVVCDPQRRGRGHPGEIRYLRGKSVQHRHPGKDRTMTTEKRPRDRICPVAECLRAGPRTPDAAPRCPGKGRA